MLLWRSEILLRVEFG